MRRAEQLRQGAHEQLRVLHALLLREIRLRFGRHRIGYGWAVAEPMLHIGVLYAMRSIVGGFAPGHVPLLLWLIIGIVPFFMFRSIVTRISGIGSAQDILILPQVKLIDIVWARTLLELATYSIMLVYFLLLYAALVGPVEVEDPLAVLGCMVLMALLAMGFGMVAVVFTSIFPSTQPLIAGVLRVLYFISGVLFSVSRIPYDLQAYLLWNPLLHLFERLHAAFFFGYRPLPHANHLGFAIGSALLLVLFGTLLLKRFRRQVVEER